MTFSEAMEKLEQGAKITRQRWLGSVYFLMDGQEIKTYEPHLTHFSYDASIMISDGWQVEGVEGEHKFYDIIDYLQQGHQARLKDWKESYIYFDPAMKLLAIHTMDAFDFVPDWNTFLAQDWMEVT